MKKLKVTELPTDAILPNPNNPRIIQDAIVPVANSIKEFGFLVPIVVNENNIILAGHARHAAAKLIGLDTIPTIQASHLEPAQAQAFMLADNRLSEKAEYDHKMLADVLRTLDDQDFDTTLTGFSLAEIDSYLDAASANFDDLINMDEEEKSEALDMDEPGGESEMQRLSFFFTKEQKKIVMDAIVQQQEIAEEKLSNGAALARILSQPQEEVL